MKSERYIWLGNSLSVLVVFICLFVYYYYYHCCCYSRVPTKRSNIRRDAWNCVCSHLQFLLRLPDEAKTYSNILSAFLCLLIFWTQILTCWVICCSAFISVSFGFLAKNAAHKVSDLLNIMSFDRKLLYSLATNTLSNAIWIEEAIVILIKTFSIKSEADRDTVQSLILHGIYSDTRRCFTSHGGPFA